MDFKDKVVVVTGGAQGIAALTHALAASLAGRVRVNSISPGWIDTSFKTYDGPDASQHFVGRVGNPMDIAPSCRIELPRLASVVRRTEPDRCHRHLGDPFVCVSPAGLSCA